MDGKQLVEALRSDEPCFGTLIVSPSPVWPKALAGANLDFVFIDTEHIPLGRETVSAMCQWYRAAGLAPIVRLPEPSEQLATMVLDGGAEGIIAPYVETAAQVRALAGAVKWRPLKGERLMQALNGAPLEPELQRYISDRNAGNVLIVNVESTPAIGNLDEIVSVPGLDAVLVGPHDLSCSLGIPEQYDHPRFSEAILQIITKARARNIGVGIHYWVDPSREVEWLKAGMNLLIHSADITLFAKHLKAELSEIRTAIGDARVSRATANIVV